MDEERRERRLLVASDILKEDEEEEEEREMPATLDTDSRDESTSDDGIQDSLALSSTKAADE